MYGLLAKAVVVLHYSFMLWVFFGGIFVLLWRRLAWAHIPAVAWSVLIMTMQSWTCPLTWTELQLRSAAGLPPYEGGFLSHYVHPCLINIGMSQSFIPYLGYVLLAINLGIYGYLSARFFQRRRAAAVTGESPSLIKAKISGP